MSATPVLITGATGYIGSRLVLDLVRRFGDEVRCRVAVRASSDVSFLKGLPVEIVHADMHDSIAVGEAVRGMEVVFHCAGMIGFTNNFRNRLHDTNVLGTRHVIDACIEHGVKRMVMTSSIAAIGSATVDGVVAESTEESAFTELQRHNVYMESKHLAELECRRGVAEGLDVVMVNPGLVIGRSPESGMPGSSSNEVMRLIYEGREPFCPEGSTGFVDVRDVSDALIAAWQKGKTGERYIIVGESLPFRELFSRIAALPGSRTGKPVMVGGLVGVLSGVAGEFWSLLSGQSSFVSIESIRQASRPARYSNRRSIEELGLSYRPFDETLGSAVAL